MFLKISQNSQEKHQWQILFLKWRCRPEVLKKKSLVQVLSGEFCEIFKNTIIKHLRWLLLLFKNLLLFWSTVYISVIIITYIQSFCYQIYSW